jgi:hypothetical protein
LVHDHFSKLLGENWKFSKDDLRIREYEIMEKRAGRSFVDKENMTLDDLKFVSFKSMCIQTKESGTEWKEEKDIYTIFIIPLNPKTMEFDIIKPFHIEVDLTLNDLKMNLSKHFSDQFEFDSLNLVKDTTSETVLLQGDEKLIENELGVKQSTSIFVEFCQKGEESRIMEHIETSKNQIEIYFNKIGQEEFTEKVTLDKRTGTLLNLKKLISDAIQIPCESFVISTKNFKVPFRELKRFITDAGLFDGSQIFIFEGKSLEDNEVSVKLYLYDPNRIVEEVPEEKSAFAKLIQKQQQFQFLGQIAVDETKTLKEWKQDLSKLDSILAPPEKLRIRIKNGPSAGAPVIIHDKPLKEIIPGIENGKHLVVQILDESEDLREYDIILKIQKWSPSLWKLGKMEEIVINQETCNTTKLLKEKIAQHSKMDVENVSISKPPMAFEFWQSQECAEVPLFDWFQY